jgi:hypothetical protein
VLRIRVVFSCAQATLARHHGDSCLVPVSTPKRGTWPSVTGQSYRHGVAAFFYMPPKPFIIFIGTSFIIVVLGRVSWEWISHSLWLPESSGSGCRGSEIPV